MSLSSSPTITAMECSRITASFAQQRKWADEHSYHDPSRSPAVNNIVLPLVVRSGSMSIENIHSSIITVLEKNTVLRTAVYFDKTRGQLIQEVKPIVGSDNYSFQLIKRSLQSADETVALLKNESINHFAKLDQGVVVRCHFIMMDLDESNQYLKPNDMIIFVLHKIAFDHNSINPFIGAFIEAYDQAQSYVRKLQYIDFTLYEYAQLNDVNQSSKMNEARQFWLKQMHGYNEEEQQSLSTTSTQKIKKRSGRGCSVTFDLDSNLTKAQIEFAFLRNVSMFELGLACYFVFLYELNNCSINDLCVACPTDNRPLIETKSMIGMFVNILPYRIKIDSRHSFNDILQFVCHLSADVAKHAQLPYQLIMNNANDLYPPKLPFHFRYNSTDPLITKETALKCKTKDGTFSLYTDQDWLHGNGATTNDLTLTMIHNHDEQKTRFVFECSTDCYNKTAISKMSQWFQNFLTDLFIKNMKTNEFHFTLQPITNFSAQRQTDEESLVDILQKQSNSLETKPHPVITNGHVHRKQFISSHKSYNTSDKPRLIIYEDLSDIDRINSDVLKSPLSSNGEIDRKSSSEIPSVQSGKETDVKSSTELKKMIAHIWQELIHTERLDLARHNINSNGLEQEPLVTNKTISSTNASPLNVSQWNGTTFSNIPTTANFYSLGGDSLQLVQVYQHYQSRLGFNNTALTLRKLLECNTIDEHAKLLEAVVKDDIQSKQWHTLHVNNGIASFAQERIFLDEQIRFSNKTAIYNELIVLRVVRGLLSIDRLQGALQCLLNKHKPLRTALIFDNHDSTLKQYITDKHQSFTLAAEQIFKNENELKDIIHETAANPDLFDLSNGRVFHCQILRQQKNVNQNYDTEVITDSDILVITFHHVAFDLLTAQIFLNDLCNAHNNNNETRSENEESLQYIDYSVHERVMDMTTSREFWHSLLKGYDTERPMSLPFDRHRSFTNQRSGSASVTQIFFNDDILAAFLNYAASCQVTLFQLGLAVFYTFLFRLTHGQSDMCVSCFNANRHRTELQNILGMFVSTLPYRMQLDSQWSFDEFVRHVQKECLSIFEHSHYPLKHILTDSQLNSSNVPFLETVFDFITTSSNVDQLSFDGTSLEQVSIPQSSEVAKFDFMLRFVYDSKLNGSRLSCRFVCSRDLFDETTVATISRRFQHLFEQLFSSYPSAIRNETVLLTPISKLNIILPEEAVEIQSRSFCRQTNIVNEAEINLF